MTKKNNSNNTLSDIDNILNNSDAPSTAPQGLSDVENLKLITEVFKRIEEETVEIAELLFDILLNATDSQVMTGNIPGHKNAVIAKYLSILNRLLKFSRSKSALGGYRVISRKMIEELDKKTYIISMCLDGGTSLDILCDVVNVENNARTPTRSPVRVVVKQAFASPKQNKIKNI